MSKKSKPWFGGESKRRRRKRGKCRSSSNGGGLFGKGIRRGRGPTEQVGAEAFSGKM